jgi:hypothetical protein
VDNQNNDANSASEYNEAEVRFHFIDPLIRKLGYPGGDDVFFKLEEKLEYPYFHIGHKSKKKDQPLGFPDYRAGLKGRRGSFIVEAKSSKAGLGPKDVEQAHSYAAHAQVGANYFMLCDGKRLEVYETLSGPDHVSLVDMDVAELEARFHEIENVLSPENLAKNCQVEHDLKLKLCDGLGSSAAVRSGEYTLENWFVRMFAGGEDVTDLLKATVPEIALLYSQLEQLSTDFELRISDGTVARDADGRILAEVSFAGATKNNAEAMRLLGIQTMTFITDAEFLSVDSDVPTVFESTADFSVSKGVMVPPLLGKAVPADVDANGDILITARMVKVDRTILGEYGAFAEYRLDIPIMGELIIELEHFGNFSMKLLD